MKNRHVVVTSWDGEILKNDLVSICYQWMLSLDVLA